MRELRLIMVLLVFLFSARTLQACTIDSYSVINPSCVNAGDGTLTINASGGPGLTYSIDGGLTFSASNVFTGLNAGTYAVVVQSTLPCSVTGSVTITANDPLDAVGWSNTASVFMGEPVWFNDLSVGFTSVTIDFGDGSDTTGVDLVAHEYDAPGVYTVLFIATNGTCTDTSVLTITVVGSSSLFIPNVFTPNLDGVNELFMPQASGMKSFECYISNRWGELVCRWSGPKGYWDGYTYPAGVACPEGTYFYIIKAVGYDGVEYDEHGIINLLR